ENLLPIVAIRTMPQLEEAVGSESRRERRKLGRESVRPADLDPCTRAASSRPFGESSRRVARIEDEERRSGLEHAHHRGNESRAPISVDRHDLPGLHPGLAKKACDLIAVLFHVAVGPRTPRVENRGTLRSMELMAQESSVRRPVPGARETLSRVGEDLHGGGCRQRDLADRPEGSLCDLLEDPSELPQHLLRPACFEEIDV